MQWFFMVPENKKARDRLAKSISFLELYKQSKDVKQLVDKSKKHDQQSASLISKIESMTLDHE